MSKKDEEKKKPTFKELYESDKWESGRKVSEASYLERKDGTKGISVKIGTKPHYMTRPRWGKTIWIDEELDLPSWLNWFIKTIKKSYFKLFGKKVHGIDEEKEYYKAKVEELTKNLTDVQTKLEEVESKEQDIKEKIEFAKTVKDNLANYKEIYKDFKKVVESSKKENKGKEEEIKTKIKSNRWLLGLECFVEAKNKRVDNQTEIDLHIKTKYEQDRIFEVKSPNINLFTAKEGKKDRRRILSPHLADGLSELILYLKRTDFASNLNIKSNYGIQKASGYILAGFNLGADEIEMLNELNFHLAPHVQIMTYNDLFKSIERELEIIEGVSKNAKK